MFLLSWQLALFALALIPLFALLTRRVGQERRRIAKTTQETLADISSQVQESLSVSGILLWKTMGRGAELADRFEGDSLRLADLEVRQRMAGRWVMASIQTSFAIMPARELDGSGGLALANGSNAITIADAWSRSPRCRRASSSRSGPAARRVLDVQTSLALFDRIFDYLDQPVDIAEKPDERARREQSRRRRASTTLVPLRRGGPVLEDVTFHPRRGATTALVGETGSGKTTLACLFARSTPHAAAVTIDGVDVRDLTVEALAASSASSRRRPSCSSLGAREPPLRPDATDDESRRRRGRRSIHGAGRAAGRPRHRRRRAGLRSRAARAADRDRAGVLSDPLIRPRRGDLGARPRDRARSSGRSPAC